MFKYLNLKRLFSTVKMTLNKQQKAVEVLFSNPKKRNPLSLQTMNDFYNKLIEIQMLASTEQVKIMIIKGQGPAFSAGHDLKQIQSSKNPAQVFDTCSKMMQRLRYLPIPTICAVNGIVAAAGFQLAMGCDLVLATSHSNFSCPGIKWGVFCSTPGVQLVRNISSQKKANQILLFGQPINAQQAMRYGIINKVVQNQQQLNAQIDVYISKINHLSGQVIKLGKQTLRKQRECQNIKQAYDIASKAMQENVKTISDCRQGLAAFTEKRKPHYKH